MRLVEYPDAVSFLKASRTLLDTSASEAENNLLISSAMTLARSSAVSSRRLSFLAVEDETKPQLLALNVADRRLILSTGESECAKFLGRALAERNTALRGVFAPVNVSEGFRKGWHSASSTDLTTKQNQFGMRLDRKPGSPSGGNTRQDLGDREVHGLCRVALPKDLRLLLQWSQSFAKECNLDESAQENEEAVRRNLELRQIFIWEDRRPVAMTGFGGLTPKGARVNMVYTEPNSRSRGYAKALVQNVSRRLLARAETKFCFLFVDSTNAAAIKVYEDLGYQRVSSFADCLL